MKEGNMRTQVKNLEGSPCKRPPPPPAPTKKSSLTVVAWMTEDPRMLFFDRVEACSYCDVGEYPIPLYEMKAKK